MLLHNHWRSNLSRRYNLVRRNCYILWRIRELIWRYHHELLGLIMSWWINNLSRVILLPTTNNPTRHCWSGNGNSSLDQGNKYLKSMTRHCWFQIIQSFSWYAAVTFIVIAASCNIYVVVVVTGSVPCSENISNGHVFTNIVMQIPTIYR